MDKSIAMALIALLASSAMAQDNPTVKDLTGGWRLHADGSRFLNPQSAPKDIVWAIRLGSKSASWNLVIIPQTGSPMFESYENDLGAAPGPVTGSPYKAQASVALENGALKVKTIHPTGNIKEVASTCKLNGENQMQCQGTAKKSDGSSEDYELIFDRM
jgi:hypothetical protein